MKKIFLSASSFLIGLTAFCQDILINVIDSDSIGCQKEIFLEVVNLSPTIDAGTVTIDWGDGSPLEQHMYAVSASNSPNPTCLFMMNHSYAVGGSYTIDVQAVSDSPSVNISIPQGNQVIPAYGTNNCAYAYLGIDVNGGACSPAILNNAQLDFTDNFNTTTTVTGLYNLYNGLNSNNAPYTVRMNDAWLLANNLTQLSADIVISDFSSNGQANVSNHYFTVDWTNTNVSPDPAFSTGSAWNFVAPLQTGNLNLSLNNLTCIQMTTNASVTITMPALYIPNTTGLLNANVSGNVLTFEVLPFIGDQWLNIPFTFPGATPAGTAFCFDVAISYIGDANVNNNNDQICGVVVNSYDPNDKQVNLGERLDPDSKEKLVYKIQFQNDGNFFAVNVKVTDVIDANLDLSTFRVVRSSHPLTSSVIQLRVRLNLFSTTSC